MAVEASRIARRRPARGELDRKTIEDFGEQWQAFRGNDGYYGSAELFEDVVGPLLPPESIRRCRVADIGSGTGRIVRMLLEAGAAHVTAVEPSASFPVLQENVAQFDDRVTCLNVTGEELPAGAGLDYVFSIGVIHHIPHPLPTLKAAHAALKPGGRVVVWLYGFEGNRAYLCVAKTLRAFTTRLPHRLLKAFSWGLLVFLRLYLLGCRALPLPMRGYMLGHLGKLSAKDQALTIYDQLNPAYAKYYRKEEVRSLLEAAGFVDLALHHRHGYSWTAMGTKPLAV